MTFDTPPNDQALQIDDESTIPVSLEHFQNAEMSCRLGVPRGILIPQGSRAQLLVADNPRRKRLLIWTYTLYTVITDNATYACVAVTEAEANDRRGALFGDGNAFERYEIEYSGPLWVSSLSVTETDGVDIVFTDAENDIVVSYVEDDWSH